jgi:hypothetical protein
MGWADTAERGSGLVQADLVEVRRQRVQTRMRTGKPPPRGVIRALTKLGMKRRRVCTLE